MALSSRPAANDRGRPVHMMNADSAPGNRRGPHTEPTDWGCESATVCSHRRRLFLLQGPKADTCFIVPPRGRLSRTTLIAERRCSLCFRLHNYGSDFCDKNATVGVHAWWDLIPGPETSSQSSHHSTISACYTDKLPVQMSKEIADDRIRFLGAKAILSGNCVNDFVPPSHFQSV